MSADRAGFSVIVLSNDLRGIELAFWQDEVWAQADSPLFTHAEGAAFDSGAGRTHFRLEVRRDRYELRADGGLLLAGPLRDYSTFGSPYNIADFVFFGDDTSRGRTLAELARIEVCAGDASISPGPSLRVSRDGQDVVLTVADTGASEHRIYRDRAAADAGLTLHVAGTSPMLRDPTAIPAGGTFYFLSRDMDDCGLEHD